MRVHTKSRLAFTMLELIFAIVILGIVSSIGSSIIVQVFESNIIQRAQYRANTKSELALNQIENRLRYAITSTVGARATLGDVFVPRENIANSSMRVLQWVGYDGDGFEAITSTSRRPGWSGFCDTSASTSNIIDTPGSNLELVGTIIANLKGSVDSSVLYFSGVPNDQQAHGISAVTGKQITLDANIATGNLISERYRLAWSSYALEVDNDNNLVLHYNFAPITGAVIDGNSSILLRNVENFRFMAGNGVMRLKICVSEQIGDANTTVSSCKEKVVF